MLLASRVLTCWSFQLQMVSWFEAAGSNGHQTTGQVSEEQLCISDEPSLLCLWIQGPRTRRDDQPMGCESWILHVGIRWHRHFEDPWFAILPNPPQHWTRAFPVNLHPNIELVLFQWASATLDESKVGGFKYFLNIFQLVSLGGSQSKISRYKTGHWVTNDCRMICFFFSPLAHHVALGPNPSSKIQPGGRGGHWCEPLPLSVYDCPLDGRRSGNRLNGRGMYRELD